MPSRDAKGVGSASDAHAAGGATPAHPKIETDDRPGGGTPGVRGGPDRRDTAALGEPSGTPTPSRTPMFSPVPSIFPAVFSSPLSSSSFFIFAARYPASASTDG